VDVSSDDEIGEGLMGPLDLKSISELRDKGENRRFLDEIGYLLEGLDSKMTIPVKRLR
jgi:Wings apart-like protein regulation of heterochromatin